MFVGRKEFEVRKIDRNERISDRVYVPESPPLAPARDQRTWVVFHGKVPGIYDES